MTPNYVRTWVSSIFRKRAHHFPVEASEKDIQCIELCIPFTMTSVARLYATLSAVKYVVNNNIQGDLVECGVWRGGNSMVIAKTLFDLNQIDRCIYLFDTFEGMTSPTSSDVDFSGKAALFQLKLTKKKKGNNIWCIADIDDVRSNLSLTGYPQNQIHLIKGDVADTLEDESSVPKHISLLRLDTDWYDSTKKELEVLFPRLVRGGVCLIDDYGHWQGARKAVDEYLAQYRIFPLIHVTDYTGRVFIKN
jgi:O-methyltransferase